MLGIGAIAAPLLALPWSGDAFARPKLGVLLILSVAGLLAGAIASARWRFRPWIDGSLLVLIAAASLATVLSTDPAMSLVGQFPEYQGLVALGVAVAGLALARIGFDNRSLVRWCRLTAMTGGVVALLALAQAAGIDPVWGSQPGSRTFATLGQPNNLGAYLVLTGAITAAMASLSSRRALWSLLVVIQAAALVTTMSRGALLGAAIAAAVLVAGLGVRMRLPRLRFAAPMALGTLLVLVAVPGVAATLANGGARATTLMDPANTSIRQHAALWEVALAASADKPWLGWGPDTFPTVFTELSPAVLSNDQQALFAAVRPESPHSVPLAIASGSGQAALAAYVALVTAVILIGARALRHGLPARRPLMTGLLAAATGHVVTDLFMTGEVTSTWLFWVILGGILALAAEAQADGRWRKGAHRKPGTVDPQHPTPTAACP